LGAPAWTCLAACNRADIHSHHFTLRARYMGGGKGARRTLVQILPIEGDNCLFKSTAAHGIIAQGLPSTPTESAVLLQLLALMLLCSMPATVVLIAAVRASKRAIADDPLLLEQPIVEPAEESPNSSPNDKPGSSEKSACRASTVGA
jgi:hypothetical protein